MRTLWSTAKWYLNTKSGIASLIVRFVVALNAFHVAFVVIIFFYSTTNLQFAALMTIDWNFTLQNNQYCISQFRCALYIVFIYCFLGFFENKLLSRNFFWTILKMSNFEYLKLVFSRVDQSRRLLLQCSERGVTGMTFVTEFKYSSLELSL